MYLFGYKGRAVFPAKGVIPLRGPTVFSRAAQCDADVVADLVETYPASRLSTLDDDLEHLSLQPILGRVHSQPFGSDRAFRHLNTLSSIDLGPSLRQMRRTKYGDEIAVIQSAINATEAGYRAVESVIAPGLSEIELFARFHRAATVDAGEPIGDLGNDFRGGAMGGAPREMPLLAGDLVPLDAGAVVGHYHADLCRTYAVSGVFSPAQQCARDRVLEALAAAESLIEPGRSCAELFTVIHDRLNGAGSWSFPHHLGHGIGLKPHEAPRLNPRWNDRFEPGDVFTLEPGLYGAELRAGVRIEHNYVLTDAGLRRLSV